MLNLIQARLTAVGDNNLGRVIACECIAQKIGAHGNRATARAHNIDFGLWIVFPIILGNKLFKCQTAGNGILCMSAQSRAAL